MLRFSTELGTVIAICVCRVVIFAVVFKKHVFGWSFVQDQSANNLTNVQLVAVQPLPRSFPFSPPSVTY